LVAWSEQTTEDSVFEKRIDTDCAIPPGIQEIFEIPIMVLDVEINFFKAILFTSSIDETIYKNSSLEFWRACLCG
jgi:hypothetical protein